jgi:hypothetical protein
MRRWNAQVVKTVSKLSEPQLRGLQATARGEVILTHTGSVYTITGPVGSKTLWYLLQAGLIVDGPKRSGLSKTPMVLSRSARVLHARALTGRADDPAVRQKTSLGNPPGTKVVLPRDVIVCAAGNHSGL